MNALENVKLVRECYAAFGAGDLARLQATLAPEVVWDFPETAALPWAGRFEAPAGVVRFIGALVEHASVEEFAPDHFLSDGDTVMVLGHERFLVKATGRTWSVDWAHVWTVAAGRITSFREYTDTAAMVAAMQNDLPPVRGLT